MLYLIYAKQNFSTPYGKFNLRQELNVNLKNSIDVLTMHRKYLLKPV